MKQTIHSIHRKNAAEKKPAWQKCMQLTFFLFLFAVLYSCAGAVDESYTNAIPADATMVASVNVKELMAKAGYKDPAPVAKTVGSLYPEETMSFLPDVVDAVLSEPDKSGIDFDAPIYMFRQPDGVSFGIVMKLDKKEDAEAWVESTIGTPGSASVTFAYFDENSLCIYEKRGASVWQQPATPEARFNQSVPFQKMKERKGDVRYYCNTRELMKMYSIRAVSSLPPLYTETSIVGSCNFDKGEASVTAALVANTPEAEAGLTDFKATFRPSEGKFIECLPESTVLLASVCGKGTGYYDYLSNMPYMGGMLMSDHRFWKNMFELMDGEAVFALTELSDYAFSFMVYADLAQDVTEEQVKKALSRKGLQELYWGVQDHRFYLTNDKALGKNAFKEAPSSLRKSEYGKQSDGKPMYMLADFAKIMSNPALDQAMIQTGGKTPLQMYALFAGMECELDGAYELVMRIGLKDKKENILKIAVDFFLN